jgi:methylmalonyl-CoA mutase cobalamin-binding subunit
MTALMATRLRLVNDQHGYSDQQGYSEGGYPADQMFPQRRPTSRPPSLRPGGRHRRDVPVSLSADAPALVIAVPGVATDLASGPVGELMTILRVDNPAVDVRACLIDAPPQDPESVASVLTAADAAREAGDGPCAVVIPLIVAPHPPLVRRLREAIAASGVNATVSGFVNSNGLVAEALHIRLAEAGLARADRVRLFSIVTAADGIVVATVGGPDAAMATNVTAVMLAARLALPVFTASLDSSPTVREVAQRLKEMGVNRIAVAPCMIGPEASYPEMESMGVGEVSAPIGAHSNIAKLAAGAYGHVLSKLDAAQEQLPAHEHEPAHEQKQQ